MSITNKLLFIASLLSILGIASSSIANTKNTSAITTSTGYSTLKLLLEDEQHLTLIRRTKMVISFSGINESSVDLIDEINDSAETALDELEKLADKRPVIIFDDFADNSIAKATHDSLRMATAREFFIDTDDFEKSLLLSQLKVLRVISHLAVQLEKQETNIARKKWLAKLAERYEKHYQKINSRISIATK
ncbi:MAG: hypothetical protein ACC650_04645 [Gammaproteobacteria bacterium]